MLMHFSPVINIPLSVLQVRSSGKDGLGSAYQAQAHLLELEIMGCQEQAGKKR